MLYWQAYNYFVYRNIVHLCNDYHHVGNNHTLLKETEDLENTNINQNFEATFIQLPEK